MSAKKSLDRKNLVKGFFIKAVIFYVLWQILYIGAIRPDGKIDNYLTNFVINGTVLGLDSVGFKSSNIDNIVFIGETAAVRVENQCNGLELLALFVGFIVCFPGRWKPKLLVSVIGCFILLITNIIREIFLALNYVYFNESFELNHKYTYTIVVYAIVFLMWKFWVKHYSIIGTRHEKV